MRWVLAFARCRISVLDSNGLPDIPPDIVTSFPSNIQEEYLVQLRNELSASIDRYQQRLQEVRRLEGRTAVSDGTRVVIVISPIFIAIATGLAMFKAIYGP